MQAAPQKTVAGQTQVWSISLLLSCIRFDEVLVLQGSPLLGAVFSMGHLTAEKVVAMALLAAGNACLMAHVFVLNDWSGMNADLRDPNRMNEVLANRGIGRTWIRFLWIALLALSLILVSPLGLRTLMIALAIAGLSALYSAPGVHIKGIPIANSALHFAGGLLHFLLGYSVFRGVDGRGLALGCFFALTFVAGHLVHETRDSEWDLLNGIRTNAVTFGKARSFVAGVVLFIIADALLVVLAALGTVPRPLVLIAVLCPFLLFWSFQVWRAGLTFESVRRFQMRYRALYAVIGLMMVFTALSAC